jgi:hypothetical protein
MGSINKWRNVAIAMAATGAVLVVLTAPILIPDVVAHEQVTLDGDSAVLGPYDLKEGDYWVWAEDYYPGYDGDDFFWVEPSPEFGYWDDTYTFGRYTTATIDGVDCELVGVIDHMSEGEWTFVLDMYGEPTGDSIDVFIVKQPGIVYSIGFAAGLCVLLIGLVVLGLIMWSRIKERKS